MVELETLVHWVKERENIRVRKESGHPFPWTDDQILKTYRFCCVRREDDRVTRWVKTNIRERYEGHPYLWFMLCIARMINWPDTLETLINSTNAWPNRAAFEPRFMGQVMEDRALRGEKVWTGAYLITAPPTKGAKKTTFVAEKTLGNLWRDRARFEKHFAEPTLRSTHALLTRFDGWGPFMAYQAIVDMRFTDLLSGAPDVFSWCAAGPGTLRGLNRLHGRLLDAKTDQDKARREIIALWPILVAQTGVEMDLSDVPNCLCEFDKYLRVKNGEGKPRSLYVPGRGS